MKRAKSIWKTVAGGLRFYLLMLLVFLSLSILSLHILQDELLENAQQTGSALARSYTLEEERSATTYESMIKMAAQYLDRQFREGATEEELRQWMQVFFETIQNVTGSDVVDPYAVIDGKIVAANDWEGDDAYDFAQTNWYQEALAANGRVIYTDAYTDAITGRSIITIAVKSGTGANVVAFDIFPEHFRLSDSPIALPEGSSYFLCDRKGALLYAQTKTQTTSEELQAYLDEIVEKIHQGKLAQAESYVLDLTGRQRGVYYSIAENGWISIVTVPFRTILKSLLRLTIAFSVVFLIFILFTIFMGIRDYRLRRRVERTNETVRVLGNSYYAIYRIDYTTGSYEIIKGSEYVRKRLKNRGEYPHFLTVLSEVIEPAAIQEFLRCFSLENIRALVRQRVRDFGGDFRRSFHGEYRWVNVRLLFDESLSKGEVVLCFREIEAEKQAQLKQMRLLEDALDAAKRNEQSQNQFFSAMSHDMRTPLNAIIGLSELAAKQTGDPEKTGTYLQKINRSSKQLLGLINDILEFSRLKRGKLDLNEHAFDLEDCLNECVDLFREQIEVQEKHLQVVVSLEDHMVMADSFRITQILNNMLSNAVKFTQPGDKILVQLRQVERQEYAKYQFVVSDTGAGMSREFLAHVFEPYEREARFGARKVAGTGLGMAIVKNLVSQMNGQIAVESELGKGTTFTVTLPLERIQPSKQNEALQTEESYDLEGRRILLAEDNEVNMEIATELLSMHGAEVTQAWNGREAVERFAASQPGFFDAILMDMQMPEMNGCDAARAIRAMTRSDASSVPILAVTANAFAEDIAATTEAGMDAHISKPIDVLGLCQTLTELLRRKESKMP